MFVNFVFFFINLVFILILFASLAFSPDVLTSLLINVGRRAHYDTCWRPCKLVMIIHCGDFCTRGPVLWGDWGGGRGQCRYPCGVDVRLPFVIADSTSGKTFCCVTPLGGGV